MNIINDFKSKLLFVLNHKLFLNDPSYGTLIMTGV